MTQKHIISLKKPISLDQVLKRHGFTPEEAFTILSSHHFLPLSIFSSTLTPLEAICKYLKEAGGLRFSQIAPLLLRDQRNIRTAYINAARKYRGRLQRLAKTTFIPLVIFHNPRSIQTSLVSYLHNNGWSVKDIALALSRDAKTIYTVLYRARGGTP